MQKKFREMDMAERLDVLRCDVSLSEEDVSVIRNPLSVTKVETVNHMIENAIGVYPVPLGIATNFSINGKRYYVPMATEEPSVIAGSELRGKIS